MPVILDLIVEYTPEGGVPQSAEFIYKNKNKNMTTNIAFTKS